MRADCADAAPSKVIKNKHMTAPDRTRHRLRVGFANIGTTLPKGCALFHRQLSPVCGFYHRWTRTHSLAVARAFAAKSLKRSPQRGRSIGPGAHLTFRGRRTQGDAPFGFAPPVRP